MKIATSKQDPEKAGLSARRWRSVTVAGRTSACHDGCQYWDPPAAGGQN
jgi:hypothetical protein